LDVALRIAEGEALGTPPLDVALRIAEGEALGTPPLDVALRIAEGEAMGRPASDVALPTAEGRATGRPASDDGVISSAEGRATGRPASDGAIRSAEGQVTGRPASDGAERPTVVPGVLQRAKTQRWSDPALAPKGSAGPKGSRSASALSRRERARINATNSKAMALIQTFNEAQHGAGAQRPGKPAQRPGETQTLDALLYGDGWGGSGEGSGGVGGDGRDRSSPPRLGGYVYWQCPWPESANRAGVDHAVLHMTMDVTSGGQPIAAHIVDEPGYDFATDAVRCAMEHKYIPGRDAGGTPVAGRTRPFAVRFDRGVAK
jgi:hypothetical protein